MDMFNVLSKRIVLFTVLPVLICSTLLSLFSYLWFQHTLQKQFEQLALSYFQSSSDSLTQYLHYSEEMSKWITNNPKVAKAISETEHLKEVSTIFDQMIYNNNVDISGVTIYKKNGDIYTPSRTSHVPSFSQLIENTNLKAFTQNTQKKYIWISRYQSISSFYNNRYSNDGIFSYILKLYDTDNQLLGYIVVDLDLKTLYDFFQTSNKLFNKSQVFMIRDQKDIAGSTKSATIKLNPNDLSKMNQKNDGTFISNDRKQLIMFDTMMDSNTKIVMSIPTKNAYQYSVLFKALLILFTILFTFSSLYIGIALKKSIIEPITRLYQKMQAFK
ncbi:cache domain-containing protein [Metabacillus arenae]|uniref:Cache domain-containing protein n=1 Tax=Metabacillus arenae TaxID=2771434 RepID=A0A926RXU9_9BACI|nr:cache domain-containing protein [Metabacillus arenae]MBD1382278.1 cache domain-containing protein [Metabacillus arenae]